MDIRAPLSGRRGLVLGAGGALGAAWMIGTLTALREVEGLDPSAYDVLVGTSAGSIVSALLATGTSIADLAAELDLPAEPALEGTGPVNAFDVHAVLTRIPRPILLPANPRLVARAALRRGHRQPLTTVAASLAPRGRGDLEPLADLIGRAQAGRPWPVQPALHVVAMEFDTGERIVFGLSVSRVASLPRAVMASCAAPGFFPPVEIEGRRYVDGGAASMTNLDVLAGAGLDEVLVLAPMAGPARRPNWSPIEQADRRLRDHVIRRLRAEARLVSAEGTSVRLITPTARDLVTMRWNLMNPILRRDVLHTALETAREHVVTPGDPSGGHLIA
jgi:NTE family protein